MTLKSNGLWVALFSGMAVVLFGCAPPASEPSGVKSKSQSINNSIVPNPPPAFTAGNGLVNSGLSGVDTATSSSNLPPPLQYFVNGMGNHVRHICVPATTRLYLRMTPHGNTTPLMPVSYSPTYSDGSLVYDGTPAFYNRFRVRMSIPNTAASWDFSANLENHSVIGNYSSYIDKSTAPQLYTIPNNIKINYLNLKSSTVMTYMSGSPALGNDPDQLLDTPEYKDVWIMGSDPNDGLCTFWEQNYGKCSNISTSLRTSETETCSAGEQKVLISNIVSDYPCSYDRIGWCNGGDVQFVTDRQQWSITIEAATENTKNF